MSRYVVVKLTTLQKFLGLQKLMHGCGLATLCVINAHLILPCIYYAIFGASKGMEGKGLYDNDHHTAQILYLLKYGFQAYLPNLEIQRSGRIYYDFNKSDTFMKQICYEYGGTLFVTYMICVSLCFT